MAIIVQKFGGTSLADTQRLRHVANMIAAARAEGHQIVVVVSAMGKTTDRLLAQADHFSTVLSPRERSALVVTGEMQSAALLAMAIQELDIAACSLSALQLQMRASGRYESAQPKHIDHGYLRELLDKGIVPVITGYQALNEKNEYVTLGRSGSDTTAVFVAAQLGAKCCEIYTDVPGVMSADPQQMSDARLIQQIPLAVMARYAQLGAEVLHPDCIDLALSCDLSLKVCSSFSNEPGTHLTSLLPDSEVLFGVIRQSDHAMFVSDEKLTPGRAGIFCEHHGNGYIYAGLRSDIIWFSHAQQVKNPKKRIAQLTHLDRITIVGVRLTPASAIFQWLAEQEVVRLVSIDQSQMLIHVFVCKDESEFIFKEVHSQVLNASKFEKYLT